ncbi:helix-turn-helix domain-containing protein [Streptomyces caniscabiei]|uniref:helix-turn-helix domain-containing protein n=1 Tax=Streptomyces caniscabiei TaxID=2746961 RepID=UPI0018728DDE|nr:helix-turn-helix domain-containing protein [Streptomyces caniscabiei]
MDETADPAGHAGEDWTVEHRFRTVVEVLDGSPVVEVVRPYGTSRQSLHTWLRRFREGGRDVLKDRSRRPHSSPSRVEVGRTFSNTKRARPLPCGQSPPDREVVRYAPPSFQGPCLHAPTVGNHPAEKSVLFTPSVSG